MADIIQINVDGTVYDIKDASKVPTSRMVQGATLTNDITIIDNFSVTLTANGWSNSQQTVTDAKFSTSGYLYIVSPDPTYHIDYSNAGIYALNVTTASSMTFCCQSTPTSAITVNVMRIKV